MEAVILVLIVLVIFLWFEIRNLSKNEIRKSQEHCQIIESQQRTIRTLKHEHAFAQTQLEKCLSEISELKKALEEAERKIDFYKNIEEASGELNVPNKPVQVENAQLDPEQFAIFSEIENSNDHFFITGKAGTGKSFLLNAFKKKTHKSNIILAPTGIAALNVGGATLHSTFGYYNLVNLDVDEISSATIRLKSEKQLILKHVSTIIIDEISMVKADTFDKIDRILKAINHNDSPFGGKQLVLFGDLFQLPPIVKPNELKFLYDRYGGIHFFYADAYRRANFHFRELTINHRQKEDAIYFQLLNRVRDGSITSEDINTLNTRIIHDSSAYDLFTALLPTKAEVERLNQDRIRQLDTPEFSYRAKISYDKYPGKTRSLETLFPINNVLRLKKGVLVMMVSNDPEQKWVNGSLGIVNHLSADRISVSVNKRTYDIHPVEFSEQEVTYKNKKLTYEKVLTVMQYPIVPAYAITIHKSQGQTYQNIICDIDRCFADGQAYVALSRCASLDGLHLTQQVNPGSFQVNKNILDFYHSSISQEN